MEKLVLDVFITKEDDGTCDVDVFDTNINERDENLTNGHLSLGKAHRYVKELSVKHTVDFRGIR